MLWMPSTDFRAKPISSTQKGSRKRIRLDGRRKKYDFLQSIVSIIIVWLCTNNSVLLCYTSYLRDRIPAYHLSGSLWSSEAIMSVKYFSLLAFKH